MFSGPGPCLTGATGCYTLIFPMTPLKQTGIRISEELQAALQTIKDRDGIPISVQVRKALEAWVESKGVAPKGASRRAVTRRKA